MHQQQHSSQHQIFLLPSLPLIHYKKHQHHHKVAIRNKPHLKSPTMMHIDDWWSYRGGIDSYPPSSMSMFSIFILVRYISLYFMMRIILAMTRKPLNDKNPSHDKNSLPMARKTSKNPTKFIRTATQKATKKTTPSEAGCDMMFVLDRVC